MNKILNTLGIKQKIQNDHIQFKMQLDLQQNYAIKEKLIYILIYS